MKKLFSQLVLLLMFASPALASADMMDGDSEIYERGWYGMMSWSGNHMFGWGGGFIGFILLVLIIVFLVLGIIYFWKEINKKK